MPQEERTRTSAINLMDEMKDSKKAEEVKKVCSQRRKIEGDVGHHENAEEVEYYLYGHLSRMRLLQPAYRRQLPRRMRSTADTYKKTSMHTLKARRI